MTPPPAVFVALGTNLGDRERNLARGVAGLVVRTASLEVPHPRMQERRFVLVPLAEIAPGVRHPVLGLTAAEMAAACPDTSAVEIYGPPGLLG